MPGNAKEAAMDAVTTVPSPVNEPIRQYPPGSPDRAVLESKVKELTGDRTRLTMTIGGRERTGQGEPIDVVAPHNYRHVLGTLHNATDDDRVGHIVVGGVVQGAEHVPVVVRGDHVDGLTLAGSTSTSPGSCSPSSQCLPRAS